MVGTLMYVQLVWVLMGIALIRHTSWFQEDVKQKAKQYKIKTPVVSYRLIVLQDTLLSCRNNR